MTTENDKLIYTHITDTSTRLAVIDNKLDTIVYSTSETNKRVSRLEDEVQKLDRDTTTRDQNLEKLIETNESKMKAWVWRTMLIIVLCGSFVWVNESREVILQILRGLI